MAIAAAQINWLNQQMRARSEVAPDHAPQEIGPNWIWCQAAVDIAPRQPVLIDSTVSPVVDTSTTDTNKQLAFFQRPIVGGLKKIQNNSDLPDWGIGGVGFTLDGVKSGKLVRVQVSGPIYATVNVRHRYHGYVRFFFQETYTHALTLETAMCGQARLLWFDGRTYTGPSDAGIACPAIIVL